MITKNIFPLEWRLSDDLVVPYHGKKVFGTFVCGGGSTMGYKLAGYDHLGGVEFTEHYSRVYRKNHHPKFFYEEDIREFAKRTDLPSELYHLDLLDGSPPCAAFSTSGSREDVWGKQSHYENKIQQKDDLPFVYCDLIHKLKPKVFLLENVSGLAKGNGKAYLKKIVDEMSDEYDVQVFLLYAASMGIPQIRNRVFVIGKQKKYSFLPKLDLEFKCPQVNFDITKKYWNLPSEEYSIERFSLGKLWDEVKVGEAHKKRFNLIKPSPNRPCFTIVESCSNLSAASVVHPFQKRKLNGEETRLLCTFPLDYDFLELVPVTVMGRSVLPVMMANISYQIYKQWLSNINE